MENIIYILSETDSDRKEADALVRKEYIRQGYINSDSPNSKKEQLNSEVVFVAKYGNKVIGTVSIFFNSDNGLPMDEIYKDELDVLRRKKKKIVEVGRLATDSSFSSKKYNKLFVVSSLFKLVFHYCIYKNIDNICISVNPKHNLFYKSIMFEDIGALKYYPAVNNAPALAKTLNISNLKGGKTKNFLLNKLFWDNPPDYKIFNGRRN